MKEISNGYKILHTNTELVKHINGVDPKTSMDRVNLRQERIPLDRIEQTYIQNCDTLAGIIDGSIVKSDHFFDGEPRFDGEPIEYAICLDKSMRPAWRLMRMAWDNLSNGHIPGVFYRNIDKERWSQLMLPGTENLQAPDVSSISLDNISSHSPSPEALSISEHIARLRATFLSAEDLRKLDEVNVVEDAWNYPTVLDNKRVAIIDEVKSSGATLKISDILLCAAVPGAKFEPIYWSVPGTVIWEWMDKETSTLHPEFAAKTVPVWYDSKSNLGRTIRDLDPIEALESGVKRQRVGAYVLSRPFEGAEYVDTKSTVIGEDLRLLAQRFKNGDIGYIPSPDRDDNDFENRIERYYHVPYKTWLASRQKRQ